MIISQNGNGKIHEVSIVQEAFLSKLTDKRVIIPAAGLGTRMGSPAAKELLPHPYYPMSFMEKALERVEKAGATPLVISRSDKGVLNSWLEEREVPHIQIEKTPEWVQSVWASRHYWGKKNLLLLPDTEFSPEKVIEDIFSDLETTELSLGVFSVENLSLWGGIKQEGERFFIAEKLSRSQAGLAWGLIGFQGHSGESFWQNYLAAQKTHEWTQVSQSVCLHQLEKFEDLTRG